MADQETILRHATAISVDGRGAVLTGPSGSGKSSLAIRLIALGATLIADDQCEFWAQDGGGHVGRPSSLPEKIEARGIGLITVPTSQAAKVELVVDMSLTETARLPMEQKVSLLGHQVKMIRKAEADHFPSTILLYLRHGIAS